MYLRHHIAHRFLTDAKMTDHILRTKYPEDYAQHKKEVDATTPEGKAFLKDLIESDAAKRLQNIYACACLPMATPHIPHHAFYFTDTVADNLDHIKVDAKPNGHYDWTVFKNIPDGKTTFIFKNNWLLRFQVIDGVIFFLRLFESQKDKNDKKMLFCFVDRLDQSVVDPIFEIEDAHIVEKQLYRMLLFFYFSQNETRIVEGGKRYGHKKQPDGLDNSTDIPVTIVNCNWNITSVRLTGFDVAGHMRMQVCGPGNKDHKLIFVQPYKKNGYVRKASKPE